MEEAWDLVDEVSEDSDMVIVYQLGFGLCNVADLRHFRWGTGHLERWLKGL